MNQAAKMNALVQIEGGYAKKPDHPALKKLDPYVTLREIPIPVPGKGEVLIKVTMASVNPSDVMFIKGMYGQPRVEGSPAGFEGVGEVVESGGGFMAARLKGKRVAFVAGRSGAWAEYAIAQAATCFPLRKDVRDEDGAAMIVNPLTAHAMFDIVRREGAKSFVMTAGASQLCKLVAGLAVEEGFRAILIVRREEQIEPLKKLGAAHVLNSESEVFGAQLVAVVKEEKPRIFLDAVTGSLGEQVFAAMGRGARWVVYGRLDMDSTAIPQPGELIFLSKRIEGFWLAKWLQKTPILRKFGAIRAVQARFASGAWNTDVATVIQLDRARAKLPEALAGANTGKVMLKS